MTSKSPMAGQPRAPYFNLAADDKLYLTPDKRARIW
jgi:hypothetical protein